MAFTPAIEIAALTDTGRVRAQNEDAVAFSAEFGFAILADGMGGYRAGEVASLMAVGVLEAAFKEGIGRLKEQPSESRPGRGQQVSALMVAAIHAANAEIMNVSREDPECNGMGTTLVAAVAHDDSITIAHIGDSRAYRFRNGAFEQITRDHSLLQEQIDAGLISVENARLSTNRNLVTRAVGIDASLDVEIHTHQILPGDEYLLCSDGLSDMVDDAGMREILVTERGSPDDICHALVNKANENGGHDNISVLLMRVMPMVAAAGGTLFARIRNWLG